MLFIYLFIYLSIYLFTYINLFQEIFFCVTEPTATINATTNKTTSTSITLQWKELPIMQENGIITYNLSLQTGNITATASTSELHHTFSDLVKFYPYNISVTPVNNAGSGPTIWLQLKTDEDGKQRCIQKPATHLRWNVLRK